MPFVFIFSFQWGPPKKKKKKLVWFKHLYSFFIFSILKVRFEYKDWKHIFSIFIFIENECSGNSWILWKFKGPHLIDVSVCVSEKSNLKEKKKKEKRKRKKTMPNYVWWIYTQNYVFKITYQIPSNVKMGYIYIYIYIQL